MENFKGHRRCTHKLVSKHRGGQDGRFDAQKREEKKK
jgi:hypothetical protein